MIKKFQSELGFSRPVTLLSEEESKAFSDILKRQLKKDGYSGEELEEAVQDGMESRFHDLTDTISQKRIINFLVKYGYLVPPTPDQKLLRMAMQAMQFADAHGFAPITGGVYLQTGRSIRYDQKLWSDADECKRMDFTTHPFWIVADTGIIPIGVSSAADIANVIASLK